MSKVILTHTTIFRAIGTQLVKGIPNPSPKKGRKLLVNPENTFPLSRLNRLTFETGVFGLRRRNFLG